MFCLFIQPRSHEGHKANGLVLRTGLEGEVLRTGLLSCVLAFFNGRVSCSCLFRVHRVILA